MRFESRDGKPITSLADWQHMGKPAAEHHWKLGRSAYELAADWIECDAADRVTALLRLRHELSGATLRLGVAEKKTQFDDNSRGPRNHELLVTAQTDTGAVGHWRGG